MASCTPEFWSLKDIRDSLEKQWNGKKKIVIPMFQRGKRWTKDKKETFIDSLRKRYPIGTLLFYKTNEGSQEIYTLIDGLQRGTAIKEYLSSPTKFFTINELKNESLDKVYNLILVAGNQELQKQRVNEIITNYINSLKSYDDLEIYELFSLLQVEFPLLNGKISDFGNALKGDFKALKDDYNDLCNVSIPAIVYTGDENTLPEIFERINSKGVALTEYEIYAASWPRQEFVINNTSIVDYILKKYDLLNDTEYSISGYDRNEKRINKNVNSFEYTFGLSKHLQNKYSNLSFYKNLKDDETNPVAFQLLNACFNTSHSQIKDVHKIILKFYDKLDILENALYSSIDFVDKCIEPISKFKGNSRKSNRIFHSQYQIMSLISFVFRKQYDIDDPNLKVNATWKDVKTQLQNNIWKYYVYDNITKYWAEGGTIKIHTANADNRYFMPLTSGQFSTAYDSYTESQINRREAKNVANPTETDIVILNTIYLNQFSAMDQLSINAFDIEHICTKDQMKKLIASCNGDGLPISHLANLCYLPEFANRSKGSKNFYQDNSYLSKPGISLSIIEDKYSFTKKSDLDFMDLNYTINDFDFLKQYYIEEFIINRNKILKEKFLLSLGFTSNSTATQSANISTTIFSDTYFRMTKVGKIMKECIQYLLSNNIITDDDLILLEDREYSKNNLGCAYPVFVEDEDHIKDSNNYVRYYETPYIYKGRTLYLCKEWYENDRKHIIKWIQKMIQ